MGLRAMAETAMRSSVGPGEDGGEVVGGGEGGGGGHDGGGVDWLVLVGGVDGG